MLSNFFSSQNLCCIIVDEVHKVSWGTSDVDKPFRQIFSQLSIIRSVCRQGVPLLALSATINVDLTKLVMASCNLSHHLKIISTYIDRKNIKQTVIPIKNKNLDVLFEVSQNFTKAYVD